MLWTGGYFKGYLFSVDDKGEFEKHVSTSVRVYHSVLPIEDADDIESELSLL